MTMKRITLQLARNPSSPLGKENQGYTIFAPLQDDGLLDEGEWRTRKEECKVVRFNPDPDERATGLLRYQGANWIFDYDPNDESDDEVAWKLGAHYFHEGEYLTVTAFGQDPLTYKVTDVSSMA